FHCSFCPAYCGQCRQSWYEVLEKDHPAALKVAVGIALYLCKRITMTSKATTPEQYINELPADRKEAMIKLRDTIRKNLPKGFKEMMGYGMMGYAVPHEIYPAGYHCNPKDPLPFAGLASQKHFIAFYHM